jgi:ribosomal-protein-alanine N-acetyltransferase
MLRADLAAVLAIEAQANPVPWQEGDFRTFLHTPPGAASGPKAWVWADPEVRGFLCAMGAADEAEVQAIAVAREHRGRGIGTALMETLCAWARAGGVRAIHLEVREGNADALAFYASRGFAASGRRPKYYRDNGETALLMSKGL